MVVNFRFRCRRVCNSMVIGIFGGTKVVQGDFYFETDGEGFMGRDVADGIVVLLPFDGIRQSQADFPDSVLDFLPIGADEALVAKFEGLMKNNPSFRVFDREDLALRISADRLRQQDEMLKMTERELWEDEREFVRVALKARIEAILELQRAFDPENCDCDPAEFDDSQVELGKRLLALFGG